MAPDEILVLVVSILFAAGGFLLIRFASKSNRNNNERNGKKD